MPKRSMYFFILIVSVCEILSKPINIEAKNISKMNYWHWWPFQIHHLFVSSRSRGSKKLIQLLSLYFFKRQWLFAKHQFPFSTVENGSISTTKCPNIKEKASPCVLQKSHYCTMGYLLALKVIKMHKFWKNSLKIGR